MTCLMSSLAMMCSFMLTVRLNRCVKVQDDLDQVKKLLDQLLDPKDGIKQTMTQTQTVIDKTDQLLENVDQVVTDVTNAPIYKFLVPTKK